ncbi:RNA polymerase sigma factor [Acidobacteriota bacterium]
MNQQVDHEEQMQILKAKKGDHIAFEFLVHRYQKNIYHLCRNMTGAHQSADDLSQDTFVKAYFNINSFKDGMNFYSWIRKIALNNSLNYLKSRKREKPFDENRISKKSNPSGSNPPQDKLIRKRMNEKFHDSLHTLPSDQKTIFILRVFENLSYETISKILKIPPGTVMSRLNRARKKLKSQMADYI